MAEPRAGVSARPRQRVASRPELPQQAWRAPKPLLLATVARGRAARPRGAARSRAVPPPTSTSSTSSSSTSTTYADTLTDRAFIALCRVAYGRLAGWQSPRSWTDGPDSYAGMVEVSRALMRGRSPAQQRDAVIAGFPGVPPWFRKLFPYSRWGAELNARITPAFFSWLVGPATVEDGVVDGGVTQASTVRIEKCRYLDESGCVAMCANLCKAPVQDFFTRELGMPLTMEPDFETRSCRMVFGLSPPPIEADPGLVGAACLGACPTRKEGGGACWQLGCGGGEGSSRGESGEGGL